jgi:hypothetical protein
MNKMGMLYIPEENEGWLEKAAMREGNSKQKWKREEFR